MFFQVGLRIRSFVMELDGTGWQGYFTLIEFPSDGHRLLTGFAQKSAFIPLNISPIHADIYSTYSCHILMEQVPGDPQFSQT